jgi:N6-L-threonylcarbamoyladenine synthase
MRILGIETSCDETSAAVLEDGHVRSNIISSQFIHRQYGGVVPELASRAHQKLIVPVVNEALSAADVRSLSAIDGVAATYGPGLMGALMVGLNFAKALSYGLGCPFVGINHMEAHMYSTFIDEPSPGYPFLCLIVSGGHTQLVVVRRPLEYVLLGETRDDAAGEAYDKVAKLLGLGFPGGPLIDALAAEGNPEFVRFPRSFLGGESDDFSFSGIKTSVLYWLRARGIHPGDLPGPKLTQKETADLCASFQAAVVEVLVEKTVQAVKRLGVRNVALAGGVSANSELRRRMAARSTEAGFRLFIPELQYCTDNGAMIALLGWMKLTAGIRSDVSLTPIPNLSFSVPA